MGLPHTEIKNLRNTINFLTIQHHCYDRIAFPSLNSRLVSRYVYLNQEFNTYICRKEILRTESKKDAIIWWQHVHNICTCCSNRICRWQSCMIVNLYFLWLLLHYSWSHWLDTTKQQLNVVSQGASGLLGYDTVLQCDSWPCIGE